MAGGERGDADGIDLEFADMRGDFGRGFEEVAHVDGEAEIGEGGGDHLGAAVVAVLAHLGDEDATAGGRALVAEGGEARLHLRRIAGRRDSCRHRRRR